MGHRARDRTKAVGVLAIAWIGFLISVVIGFYFFDLYVGVVAGLSMLTFAGFLAHELWWKNDE